MDLKNVAYINELLTITLVPTDNLRPHEEISLDNLYFWLAKIRRKQKWTSPIIIERTHNIIMDGHHRHIVAKQLGLRFVPCIITSYLNPFIEVHKYTDGSVLASDTILNSGISGNLMPPKSTKHKIKLSTILTNIPLSLLK